MMATTAERLAEVGMKVEQIVFKHVPQLEAEGARLGEHVFTERRRQRIHEARASDPHQPRLL